MDEEEFVISTITITRTLGLRDVIHVVTDDGSGEELALVDSLGLLRFAEDSVIREKMGE